MLDKVLSKQPEQAASPRRYRSAWRYERSMSLLFLLCLAGVIAVLPPLFRSYEYERLRQKYGKERGNRIGEILGIVTGYLYFGLWAGLWLSP
ncbi:MAG TPA: hypothetical protein ENG31_04250 [Candidatus Thorarchaeota archaeon]|nr:MAG: hypothetical protein DRO73_07225 [Candidatus Thorarchaeota archaeon]RLI52968.1 MAG: hypothetical protein DRO87_12320 [Candidatus Thorarchaeota archaeon]RLI61752.1 MAG: hypothetical protein DRO93_03345 [Candidatus Thorarchaeota archaeon]HDD67810.1 hypothetical protein [Candidatus Thorarchaeota archaeon]